nr:reverse transcriptase domain-containing protein [Tanacetum cinerariifolium]
MEITSVTDRTVKHPEGIAKNVIVGIGKFVFPIDFIILDMPEDVNVPLILERPILSTSHAKLENPFCKAWCVEAKRFDGIIIIRDGNVTVTYQMVWSNLRFKHLTNEKCNKIQPLLKIRYHPGKANVVADALSRKERMKSRRARAMSITIYASIKARIPKAQIEASKGTNTPAEMLKGLDKRFKRKEDDGLLQDGEAYKIVHQRHHSKAQCARSIISDRESHFTSRFWQSLEKALGTQLDLSTAYHPQTDGQSERTIQTLEDMLRACAIDFGGN